MPPAGGYTGSVSGEETDPGVAFAGSQFALWRRKKGVTQRQLMDEKIISQAPLVNFEKGRSWPRERTRAALEQRVGLPAGQITRWRYGDAARATASAMPLRTDLMVAALDIAVQAVLTQADRVPDPASADYWPAVVESLRELRKLDATVSAAARTSPSDAVLTHLRAVRRCYDRLMRAAAAADPDQVGPQLYVARTAAQMSTQEAAQIAGVPEPTINAVESCQIEPDPQIRGLLARLRES